MKIDKMQKAESVREVHLEEVPVVQGDWWAQHASYTEFRRQGVQILCASFIHETPRANVTVLTGWSECFLKYADVIKTIYEQGFNVHTYDHQSQGLSGRWLAESQSTFIESFDDYVEDLLFFQTYVVGRGTTSDPEERLPAHLVAHSMGGLVGLIAMAKQPMLFSRAALSAPMIRNKCGMKSLHYRYPLPQQLAYYITRLMHYLNFGAMHSIGFNLERPEDPLKLGVTTTDIDHLHDWQLLRQRYPHIMSTCVTNDWTLHAIRAQKTFHTMFRRVRTNTLVINAENDRFVHNRAIREFVKKAPNAVLLQAPAPACHELFFEEPSIRGATLKAITDFLTQASDNVSLVQGVYPLTAFDVTTPTFTQFEQVLRGTGFIVALAGIGYGASLVLKKNDFH